MYDSETIVKSLCQSRKTENTKILAIIAISNNTYFFIYSYNDPLKYFSINKLKTKSIMKFEHEQNYFIGSEMVSLINEIKNGNIYIYEILLRSKDYVIYDFNNTLLEAKSLAILINPVSNILKSYYNKLKDNDLAHNQVLIHSLKLFCLLNGCNIFEIPTDRDKLINLYLEENKYVYEDDQNFLNRILNNDNYHFDNAEIKYLDQIRNYVCLKYEKIGLTFESYSNDIDSRYTDDLFKHWITKIFVDPNT